jgi:hypothetical protein
MLRLRQAHHLAGKLSKMDMSKIGGDTLGRDRGVRIAYDGQNNQTFTSTKQPALKMARKTIPMMAIITQICSARNVSQLATCPDFRPVVNQRVRCSDVPWVKASGTT